MAMAAMASIVEVAGKIGEIGSWEPNMFFLFLKESSDPPIPQSFSVPVICVPSWRSWSDRLKDFVLNILKVLRVFSGSGRDWLFLLVVRMCHGQASQVTWDEWFLGHPAIMRNSKNHSYIKPYQSVLMTTPQYNTYIYKYVYTIIYIYMIIFEHDTCFSYVPSYVII